MLVSTQTLFRHGKTVSALPQQFQHSLSVGRVIHLRMPLLDSQLAGDDI
jgi:hypothetical protein